MRIPAGFATLGLLLSVALWGATALQAKPVVYTLSTVTDGRIGNHEFRQAVVTLRMEGDTNTVTTSIGSAGSPVYTNAEGTTSVEVVESDRTTRATFASGELYVRYDTGAGIAGFGSAVGPTYPVTLGCDDYAYPANSYSKDCVQGDWGPNPPYSSGFGADGIANVRAAAAAGYVDSTAYSPQIFALPTLLTQSTLLTGRIHACAATYSVGQDFGGFGNLQTCGAEAPRGLHTDRGDFYVQDAVGGSQPSGPFFWEGWFVANGGFFQVDVLERRED